EHSPGSGRDREHTSGVSLSRWRREPGQLGDREVAGRSRQAFERGGPAGAEHHGDVVGTECRGGSLGIGDRGQ
ncbi:MAG TPA: hypothetical protein VK461_04395, partial [Acidimicrobiales bacterium]|nr:hypothetical protein [Acidimicrobiales bacterium]